MSFTIWPINVGTIKDVEKSNLTYGVDHGVKIDVSSVIYVIQGERDLVVVDTGMSNVEWATKHHHTCERKAFQEPLQALLNAGFNPEEVTMVILTHLHWDHCSNNGLFKNARFFVQKEEVNYALFPLPLHGVYYESPIIGMTPPWLGALDRFEILESDKEILDGISILKIPSHSPGFQGVKVETKKGRYFIGGDFCPLFENWKDKSGNFVPSGIHVNLEDYYKSFNLVKNQADFVLPGHDPKIFDQVCYP
jgi:N-acyl homoserine lactone hydrolase